MFYGFGDASATGFGDAFWRQFREASGRDLGDKSGRKLALEERVRNQQPARNEAKSHLVRAPRELRSQRKQRSE